MIINFNVMKNALRVIPVLVTIFFISGCTSSFEDMDSSNDAAANKDNDRAKYGLRGDVKSLYENSYVAVNQSGNIVKGESTYNDFTENVSLKIKFDETGNTIQSTEYEYDGKITWKETYQYDSNGNIVEESWEDFETNESQIITVKYKFDENQNKIEEMHYTPDGSLYRRWKLDYDEKGNNIEKTHYDSEGEVVHRYTYKFNNNGTMIEENRYRSRVGDPWYVILHDGKGNRIEEKSIDKDGKETRVVLKNDENGNIVEEKWINPDGSANRDVIYEYDSRNNKIIEKALNHEYETYDDFAFKYEYDEKGNWIKRIDIIYDDPRHIVERQIEYY